MAVNANPVPFTRDEAIAVLCRVVARYMDAIGNEGDAEAVRAAEMFLISEPHLCAVCRKALTTGTIAKLR